MRIVSALAISFLAVQIMSAAPMCGTGSLSSYLSLDPAGCSIGSSNFTNFTLLSLPTGATAINAANVIVNPVNVAFNPQLSFSVSTTAGPGDFLDILFGYVVSGAPLVGTSVSASGNLVSGDGTLTVVQDNCVGGTFDPQSLSGCSGSASSLILFDIGFDSQTSAQSGFSSVPTLGVVTDIALVGGATGSVSLDSVTTGFQTVPEPGSLFVTACGLGALLYARLNARRKKASVATQEQRS